jgi:hypothetical protein
LGILLQIARCPLPAVFRLSALGSVCLLPAASCLLLSILVR